MLIAPIELLEDENAKKILSIMYIKTVHNRRFITDMDFIITDILQEQNEKRYITSPIGDIYEIFRALVCIMVEQVDKINDKNSVTPIVEIDYMVKNIYILNDIINNKNISFHPIQKLLTIVRMDDSRLKAECLAISIKKINKIYDETDPYIKMERLK